jgi:tRNA pseudouridine13 synthase
MKNIEKVHAKLKIKVDDFIVEEIGEKWTCKISEKFLPDKEPEINLEENQKDFLWCELEKRDIDHFNAIKTLASKIRKGTDSIGYAGTKDKKAHTSQRISIFKPDMKEIRNFSHPNIFLKNFKWAKRKIKIGYLDANSFKITLRDVDKKDAMKIASKIRGMSWFPNYFGQQRFGSMRGNNVKIGKFLLKKDFKKAVWTILTDINKMESPEIQQIRVKLEKEKNFNEALNYFPPFLRLEKRLIEYLSRNPEDYLGAIKKMERKSILMFINSVQSKIFNDILELSLEEGLDFTKKGQQSCILPGYKTRFYEGRLGEIEQQVLKDHELALEDFNLMEIPYLRMKGSFRKAVVEVKDLNVDIENDEEFEGSKKMILSFILPSGVYATTFLENFFEFNS